MKYRSGKRIYTFRFKLNVSVRTKTLLGARWESYNVLNHVVNISILFLCSI